MCFHYALSATAQKVANRYGISAKKIVKFEPTFHANGFNFPEMPIIVKDRNSKIASWGLIPSWSKMNSLADKNRQNTLNARAETVSDKPSFSNLITTQRCLIPATSFFEWQHRGAKKYPYSISLVNDEIFSFGGVYNKFSSLEGQSIYTFSIITTNANELMAEIHNKKKRMPLIIHPDDENNWLISNDSNVITGLMSPYSAALMKAHTVNPKLIANTSMSNSPSIVEYFPFQELQKGLF